jgi:hypothetical protein
VYNLNYTQTIWGYRDEEELHLGIREQDKVEDQCISLLDGGKMQKPSNSESENRIPEPVKLTLYTKSRQFENGNHSGGYAELHHV